jgi:tetratricopeptide (TPR) repeat protein
MKFYVILLILSITTCENIAFMRIGDLGAGMLTDSKCGDLHTIQDMGKIVTIEDPTENINLITEKKPAKVQALYSMCQVQFSFEKLKESVYECIKPVGSHLVLFLYDGNDFIEESEVFKPTLNVFNYYMDNGEITTAINCSSGTNHDEVLIMNEILIRNKIQDNDPISVVLEEFDEEKGLDDLFTTLKGITDPYLKTYLFRKAMEKITDSYTLVIMFNYVYPEYENCDNMQKYIGTIIPYAYFKSLFEIKALNKAIQCFNNNIEYFENDELNQYYRILLLYHKPDVEKCRSLYNEIMVMPKVKKSYFLTKLITLVERSRTVTTLFHSIFQKQDSLLPKQVKKLPTPDTNSKLHASLNALDKMNSDDITYCKLIYLRAFVYAEAREFDKAKFVMTSTDRCLNHVESMILNCDLLRRQFLNSEASNCFDELKITMPSDLILYKYMNFIGMKDIKLEPSKLFECTNCLVGPRYFLIAGILEYDKSQEYDYFNRGLNYYDDDEELKYFKSLLHGEYEYTFMELPKESDDPIKNIYFHLHKNQPTRMDQVSAEIDKIQELEDTYLYHYFKGLALFQGKRYVEACEHFALAISKNKKHLMSYYLLEQAAIQANTVGRKFLLEGKDLKGNQKRNFNIKRNELITHTMHIFDGLSKALDEDDDSNLYKSEFINFIDFLMLKKEGIINAIALTNLGRYEEAFEQFEKFENESGKVVNILRKYCSDKLKLIN